MQPKPTSPAIRYGHPLNHGLVGAFALAEAAGEARDLISGRRAALGTGDAWDDGPMGSIIRLPGTGGLTPTVAGLPSGNAPRTASAWVRLDSLDGHAGILSWGTEGSGQNCTLLVLSSGALYFWGDYADLETSLTLTVGAWHLVGFSYGDGVITVYRDAAAQSGSVSLTTPVSTTLRLGLDPRSRRFIGGMAGAAVWSRALGIKPWLTLLADPMAPFRPRRAVWAPSGAASAGANLAAIAAYYARLRTS